MTVLALEIPWNYGTDMMILDHSHDEGGIVDLYLLDRRLMWVGTFALPHVGLVSY